MINIIEIENWFTTRDLLNQNTLGLAINLPLSKFMGCKAERIWKCFHSTESTIEKKTSKTKHTELSYYLNKEPDSSTKQENRRE